MLARGAECYLAHQLLWYHTALLLRASTQPPLNGIVVLRPYSGQSYIASYSLAYTHTNTTYLDRRKHSRVAQNHSTHCPCWKNRPLRHDMAYVSTCPTHAPSPIPSDPFDPPSENETDIPAAPLTSPPLSSPIRLSSESAGSVSDPESRLDFRSENSGSEEEDQQTSTAGKRKRGESTPAKMRSACHSIYTLLCCQHISFLREQEATTEHSKGV